MRAVIPDELSQWNTQNGYEKIYYKSVGLVFTEFLV